MSKLLDSRRLAVKLVVLYVVSSKNVIALFWVQKGMAGRTQFPSPTAATDSSTRPVKQQSRRLLSQCQIDLFSLASGQNSLIIIIFWAGSGHYLKLYTSSSENLWSCRPCQAGGGWPSPPRCQAISLSQRQVHVRCISAVGKKSRWKPVNCKAHVKFPFGMKPKLTY